MAAPGPQPAGKAGALAAVELSRDSRSSSYDHVDVGLCCFDQQVSCPEKRSRSPGPLPSHEITRAARRAAPRPISRPRPPRIRRVVGSSGYPAAAAA